MEKVNHPYHYKTGNYECIDVMEDVFGTDAVQWFCILNAFKYLYRCEFKDSCVTDLQKAVWYLQYAINSMESEGINDEPVAKR